MCSAYETILRLATPLQCPCRKQEYSQKVASKYVRDWTLSIIRPTITCITVSFTADG